MLAPLLLAALAAVPDDPGPPNVLFVLTDDHRHDHLGCAGHPVLKTPHIDALAARGVRFANAFVTTSICAASRASIFTGRYEIAHGYTFGTPPLSAGLVAESYPAVLRRAGYRTGFVGKFGVKTAGGRGDGVGPAEMFDTFVPIDRNPYFHEQPDGTLRHETDLCGDAAVGFLAEHAAEYPDRPFCLSVSFNAAHAEDSDKVNHYPYPETEAGLYVDTPIPPPTPVPGCTFEDQPEVLKDSINRDRWYWRWDTPEKYARNLRAYYRLLSAADRNVGRIVRELERLGLADDTVVMLMGDNGYYMGSRGFAGKWSHFEESLRVPLVIADPRTPERLRGTVDTSVALNVDVPATILERCGLAAPGGYQGASLAPSLGFATPGPPAWRTDFFCEHRMEHARIPKWEGVRTGDWKYARYYETEPVTELLYNFRIDPSELVNMAGDGRYAAELDRMRARCEVLKRALNQ